MERRAVLQYCRCFPGRVFLRFPGLCRGAASAKMGPAEKVELETYHWHAVAIRRRAGWTVVRERAAGAMALRNLSRTRAHGQHLRYLIQDDLRKSMKLDSLTPAKALAPFQVRVKPVRPWNSRVWGLVLLSLALPVWTVKAQFSYSTNKGAITITKYTGTGGTVTIPSAVGGLPVTSIGSQAFGFSMGVTNVIIPNGVTNIGVSAFTDCSKLVSITMGTGVKTIGDQAFMNCASLAGVSIPSGATNIGSEAFYACSSLASVTLPTTVRSIAGASFSWCAKLSTMSIPAGLTNIGAYAFDSCASLSAITVDSLNPSYRSLAGVLFDKKQTTLIQCPGAKAGSYAVPNGVTTIGASAFRNCNGLTSISIPSSVTNIGTTAFSSGTSLSLITVDALNPRYSSLAGALFDKAQANLLQCPAALAGTYALPNSVTNVETTAFIGCEHLTAITAGAGNPAYSSVAGVLFNKNGTTLVQCPGGITGSYSVPNGVKQLGDYSLAFCLNLTGVSIPGSVTSIGLATFAGCASLTNIAIPASVSTIGLEAFEACYALRNLVLSNGLASLGSYAFYQCTSLTNVSLPNTLTSVPDHVFQGCSSLVSATLGNNVTNIGPLAFGFCPGLTRLYCRGNAPSADPTAFVNDSATVYYLSGTTGWPPALAGLTTAPWNPVIQTRNTSFGVRTNQFSFSTTGPANLGIIVEASTNLSTWSPVQTNALTGGSAFFSDPQWTNSRARFYRIRSP